MGITEEILSKEAPHIADLWRTWAKTMYTNVEFWQIEGENDIHTEGHCERVLLHALRIADARNADPLTTQALCHAAIFHDTRRKDNFLDVGHGERAAQYYKQAHAQLSATFLPEAYAAIKFHDRNDAEGENFIRSNEEIDTPRGLEVYRIFKDADALDRLRLGPWMLDVRFIRTPEAKTMLPYAQSLVEQTIDPEVLKATLAWTKDFMEKHFKEKH